MKLSRHIGSFLLLTWTELNSSRSMRRRSTQIHFKGWENNRGLMPLPFAKIKHPIKSANFWDYLHAWGGVLAVGSFVPSSVLMSMAWGRRGGRWQRKTASLGEDLSSWTVGDRNNWKWFPVTVLFFSFFVSTPPPSHLKKKLIQRLKNWKCCINQNPASEPLSPQLPTISWDVAPCPTSNTSEFLCTTKSLEYSLVIFFQG